MCAICTINQGKKRAPTTSISATNTAIFPNVSPTAPAMRRGEMSALSDFIANTTAGRMTMVRMIKKSSTSSQDTLMRPSSLLISLRSSSTRRNTMVLATESDAPSSVASRKGSFNSRPSPSPTPPTNALCSTEPGTLVQRTDQISSTEIFRPTPNISRMMPISESCIARCTSAVKPGEYGPTARPASKYPTTGEKRRR